MRERKITRQNELHILIEDYLNNPLENELEREIPGLTPEEQAARKADVETVLEGRKTFEVPSAQILHNIMEVWRACRPSIYKKLKRTESMPLMAEKLLQENHKAKAKLPVNRETTDVFTMVGDEDPLTYYPGIPE